MSRERMIVDLYPQENCLQYDEGDPDRIAGIASEITSGAMDLINYLGMYSAESTAEVDEDSASRMREVRQDLIEKWCAMQATVSALALTFRIDSNEAFSRYVRYIGGPEDGVLDLSGL